MTNTHGHVTIVDRRPPKPPVEIVGRIYNIVPPVEPEAQFSRVNLDAEDVEDDAEVEAKVVKGRRGRRPVVTSDLAETA